MSTTTRRAHLEESSKLLRGWLSFYGPHPGSSRTRANRSFDGVARVCDVMIACTDSSKIDDTGQAWIVKRQDALGASRRNEK